MSVALRRVLLCGAVSALWACDSDNGPDLSGDWAGSVSGPCGTIVSLALAESGGGVLSGTASLSSPVSCGFASAVNYSVSGEHDDPAVQMTLTPSPGQNVTATRALNGSVSGGNSIQGTLDGSAVTLTRQ